jgi:DNA-binding IclR family transcriptional regulator
MHEHEPTRREATGVAEEILEILRAGEVREYREVAEAADLPEDEVERILDSLARMGFVEKNAKITNSGLDFLVRFFERMGFVKKKVRITNLGHDFLKLPGEEEEEKL